MEINRQGCTRIVILTKNYAIKIPNFLGGYKSLLNGLTANLQEKELSKLKWSQLCPVIFSFLFSFVIVMPKCRELSNDEFCNLDLETCLEDPYMIKIYQNGYHIKVENKTNSFGWLNGKIVVFDYGN